MTYSVSSGMLSLYSLAVFDFRFIFCTVPTWHYYYYYYVICTVILLIINYYLSQCKVGFCWSNSLR